MTRVKWRGMCLAGIAFLGLAPPQGRAAAAQGRQTAEKPVDAAMVVPLYAGLAPGSEGSTWHEQLSPPPWGGGGGRLVRNVVQPTLTIFQPPQTVRRTHTAVIVAPGGGFRWLSIDSEGYDVARALAARGIVGIVLKYRLVHTPEDESAFRTFANGFLGGLTQGVVGEGTQSVSSVPRMDPQESEPGRADGLVAVRHVRQHAAEWGIDPAHIGIVGFSAGSAVAHETATRYNAGGRPNFVGEIYGFVAPDVRWPADVPPLFLAVAGDDPIAIEGTLTGFATLRAQKHPAELHVYYSGGHGFGVQKRGLTTDGWITQFLDWIDALGMTAPGNRNTPQ